ncbi:uncharacterized protein LOC120669045 [Panicum virgatum]|uniref:uncharacterized protein LOC120669045 n=1 Tax=Panicum virgatum TaxID=38727 RepID=UPI0019D5721F|nr:uncharacterized protein LOC120669045 [Panicum virgatum]
MPSSCSSSVQILDPIPARASGTTPVDTSGSDDDDSCFGFDGGAASASPWPAAGRIASSFRSQAALDVLCKKNGVDTREFAPLPTGGLRACSPPPAGAVCVYADALKAGMRVPLDPFFRDVLSHFGLAPSQLAPNCWRVMAAFLALSRAAGIRTPSVAVFRQFFSLRALKVRGLYCFSPKDAAAGLDPSIYNMLQNMRAEKAAAEAAAAPKVTVKSEPGGSGTPDWTPATGKKRKMPEEDKAKEGFSARQDRKPQHAPDRHDGDTVDWEAARQLLQGIVSPARERAFLVAKPFNIIASSYVATLQAANYATASLGHALKLQEELEKARAELAEAKKAAAAEAESARAAAVQEFLGSKEHERRLVEEAFKGYERGLEDMKRVAVGLRPDIDPARLFVPPGGFQ